METSNISSEIFWFPYNSNPYAAASLGKQDSPPDENILAQLLLSAAPDVKERSKSEWIAEKDKLVVKTVREKNESGAFEEIKRLLFIIYVTFCRG